MAVEKRVSGTLVELDILTLLPAPVALNLTPQTVEEKCLQLPWPEDPFSIEIEMQGGKTGLKVKEEEQPC